MNAIRDALDNPRPAPSMAEPGDFGPELEKAERPPFPLDGPVKCLGIKSDTAGSQRCFYLDYRQQIVGLEAGNRHGKNSMIALYGPSSGWLEANWPQYSKPVREQDAQTKRWVTVKEAEIVGFDQAETSRVHIEECMRQGVFNLAGRMRGPGAHRLADGTGLVLHCGDKVMVSLMNAGGGIKRFHWINPGLFERYVYSADEALPRPWHEPVGERVAEKILALLQTWNWKRPLLDARFVLGGIGCSLLGGAFDWRSNVYITGGKGCGKSTLNGKKGLISLLFGRAAFRTANTSAAGLRQSLKNSTVPVMLDEVEASKDNRRITEVIELARIAASGDAMTRGSADHTAQEFTLQSSFWFSGINIPPMEPQDRSRFAFCELQPFDHGARAPDFARYNFPELGRQLLRRMVDGWERLGATKNKFHDALTAVGHDSRACDQFGTLLACADVLLNDHDTADGLPDDEEVGHWARLCRPQRLAEVSEATPDHVACVNHILTSQQQSRGGEEREAIASWIGAALDYAVTPLLEDGAQADRSARRLAQLGLKLVNARWNPGKDGSGTFGAVAFEPSEPGFLAVANEHQALARIFDNTTWQGSVWKQALQRNPGAISGVRTKFGHVNVRATLVPLYAVLDEEDLPQASRLTAEQAAAWVTQTSEGAET